jgi:prefoldin subunit 5
MTHASVEDYQRLLRQYQALQNEVDELSTEVGILRIYAMRLGIRLRGR